MLQRISLLRHAVVATGVVGVSMLGAFGVIGAGDQSIIRDEHFDAKHVTIRPAGEAYPDGVRIREVVDIDFVLEERRGYQREIPVDFGEPVDIEALSPDANAEVNATLIGNDLRIRVGNPSITFTGQRRYLLEYTLPEARLSSGELNLDIIGTDETFVTDSFTVEVIGFELDNRTCDVGRRGTFGGCSLDETDDGYEVVFDELQPGEGITIGGEIAAVEAVSFGAPAIPPERNPTGLRPLGLLQLAVGAVSAIGVFGVFRRLGDNEVFGGGGAADAAFGDVPVPVAGDPVADVPTHRVPDSRLADLATIEFAPPRGVEPWHGNVLLSEQVGDESVSAWFSEMVARGAIEIEGDGPDAVLRVGQSDARLSAVDRRHLARLFEDAPAVVLGKYNKDFTATWNGIKSEQRQIIRDAGWWERPPGSAGSLPDLRSIIRFGVIAVVLFMMTGMATVIGLLVGVTLSWVGVAILTLVIVGVVAGVMYARMLASRTAVGSALTLRTESFRRFLEASEGKHVDWAWENGLMREYSAWAVALGAADAWSSAIESSNIDHPEQFTSPLLVHSFASSFGSSRTPPSSSGSGGGGGFSGGGVGGGGGGGSSGSW